MNAILGRVQIEAAPVVEIDTEAPAAYIRVALGFDSLPALQNDGANIGKI
jgi:hypothetical protein